MTALPIVHVAAGDPFNPGEGMDVILQANLNGLRAAGPVEGYFFHHRRVPDPAGSGLEERPGDSYRNYAADLATMGSGWRRNAAKALHILGGGYLPSIAFASSAARRDILARVRSGPALIVIDHIHALVNLPLGEIRRAQRIGSRIIFVSYDFTYDIMMDAVHAATNPLRRKALELRAKQTLKLERAIVEMADRVVFVSAYDKNRTEQIFGPGGDRYHAMLPEVELVEPQAAALESAEDSFIFVGAPSHYPNKVALEWIAQRFAPAFRERNGKGRILLIGKGTEPYSNPALGVEGLGFVSTERMDALLRSATGMLCPIEHGSGIKIKLLDAVVRGCPVLATAFSLRGYEVLDIPPLLFADDPSRSAAKVQELQADRRLLRGFADRALDNYVEPGKGKGAFLRLIEELR